MSKYTIILNDRFNTIIESNTLTTTNTNGEIIDRYSPTARIIDNTAIMPRKEPKERINLVAIDTTPFHEWQRYLKRNAPLEASMVHKLGFEFRSAYIKADTTLI